MSSDAEFIVVYIADAAGKGEAPAELAKKEIQEIDESLAAAEKLKLRRMKLIAVLDHLGDDTYRRRRSSATPSSDDIDTSSEDIKDLLKKICDVIGEGPIMVGDLVQKVGGYDQDFLIMRAVKLLGDQEIVSRDSEGRVQPGKNWKRKI